MTWEKPKDLTMVGHIKEGIHGVRIDRTTKWGNPFPIVKGSRTRDQAVAEYKDWINHPDQAKLRARIVPELKGKILLCWCKRTFATEPECHGDILAAIANGGEA